MKKGRKKQYEQTCSHMNLPASGGEVGAWGVYKLFTYLFMHVIKSFTKHFLRFGLHRLILRH